MFSKILLVAAMSVGAAACVGDVPDDPGDNGGSNNGGSGSSNAGGTSTGAQLAKKSYDDNVYPIVSSTCGGCHGTSVNTSPVFVGASKDTAYAAIVDYSQLIGSWTPETAGVLKVPQIPAHANVRAYTQPEKDAITAWLSLESTWRATGGGTTTPPGEETPGAASTRLTKAFQDCMSQAEFTALQAASKIANQQSGEGSCDKCHQSGQGAMIANAATNPDLLPMFPLLKTNAYFLATFYTVNVAQKPYSMTFNQAAFTRVATRTFPHQDHPNFTADPANNNAQGLKAMKDFLDKTKAALDAQGNCPAPRQ